jgi:hypothetical protein
MPKPLPVKPGDLVTVNQADLQGKVGKVESVIGAYCKVQFPDEDKPRDIFNQLIATCEPSGQLSMDDPGADSGGNPPAPSGRKRKASAAVE